MALYIQGEKKGSPIEWFIGQPLPLVKGRMLTFQADGEELLMITKAMFDTTRRKDGQKESRTTDKASS